MYNRASSQEDNRKLVDDDSTQYNAPTDNVMVLRLKKSYKLGDGLSLRSPKGGFNISQTIQTLYGVSTPNKNLSALSSQFAINRARLSIATDMLDKKIELDVRLNFPANYQSATTGNRTFNNVLQEAYISYKPTKAHTINVGLRADYVDSREIRIEGENLGFINRSALSGAFDAIFDFGIRYKGQYKVGKRSLLKSYLSVTTGDSRAALQKNFGGYKYGIRLDYLPFDNFSDGGEFYMDDIEREKKPKLVIGGVYSYNDGTSSAVGTNGGRYLYGDMNQKILLPQYSKWIVDYLFKYQGFYSMGEYVATSTKIPNGIAGEFKLSGAFTPYPTSQGSDQTASIVMSRLNLGSGFNFQMGYILPSDWAFALRYSELRDNAGSANFADQNKHYSFVVSKYISGNEFKVQWETGFDELKSNLQTSTQAGTYYSQIQFTLQL
jgi:hypothetical protein